MKEIDKKEIRILEPQTMNNKKDKQATEFDIFKYEQIVVLFFYINEDNTISLNTFLDFIRLAKTSIDICIYSFTSHKIVKAINDLLTNQKNITVQILADQSQNEIYQEKLYSFFTKTPNYSQLHFLKSANEQIHIKKNKFADFLVHSKYIIIDNKFLATGSFNYTQHAEEQNDENLLLIREQSVVEKYKNNFNRLWAHKRYITVEVKPETKLKEFAFYKDAKVWIEKSKHNKKDQICQSSEEGKNFNITTQEKCSDYENSSNSVQKMTNIQIQAQNDGFMRLQLQEKDQKIEEMDQKIEEMDQIIQRLIQKHPKLEIDLGKIKKELKEKNQNVIIKQREIMKQPKAKKQSNKKKRQKQARKTDQTSNNNMVSGTQIEVENTNVNSEENSNNSQQDSQESNMEN